MSLDETADAEASLLWRIRGIDSRWYALFLGEQPLRTRVVEPMASRPSCEAWVLDLYCDDTHVGRYLHGSRAAAARRARRTFLECQLPPQPTRLWRRAARDGCVYALYISCCGDRWQLTAHRDDILWGVGTFASETQALTRAWRAYEELPRPPGAWRDTPTV